MTTTAPEAPLTLVRVLDRLTESLEAKETNEDTWEDAFAETLARYHLAAYAHGAGVPLKQLTPEDHDTIQAVIDRQKEFLRGFAQAWKDGRYKDRAEAAMRRAKMYADATLGTWWMGHTRGYPLPAWPGDGTTQCKTRCRCSWDIQQLEGQGNADATWHLGHADHCQTCLERSEQWAPLQIRNGELLTVTTKGWVTIHGHPVLLGADKGSAGGGGGGSPSKKPKGADPRYDPNVERHDLAKLNVFAGTVRNTIDNGDGTVGPAPFAEAFTYDAKAAGMRTFKPTDVIATQTYYTEPNLARLSELPPDKRARPVVFNYEGKNYLMDGTHRVLLNIIEAEHRNITLEADYYVSG